ncbi:hypothetical protein AOQ84DRAFT_390358 [Glonium stellatum]|uniref:Maintenance of telomere capping protein 6 n=1 Tax=Glonium stellatum TaxID=574774 RepID=A0A8E2EWG3_9PEZI|nr:hypothetical protein AOQ84DRAFT_390358 [Glonium stellatum]
MSSVYDPDDAAALVPPWNTAFRSQRDVALQVPINYVTVAAVSLRAACFPHNLYEDADARKCFSNLLASGFRRFSVDLYWDAGRSVWTLCPAEIPASVAHSGASASSSTSHIVIPSRSAAALQSAQLRVRDVPLDYDAAPTSFLLREDLRLFEREESASSARGLSSASAGTSSSRSFTALNATNSTANSSVVPLPTEFPTGGEPLIEIGPYNCTSTIGFSTLADVLAEYLSETGNTLEAVLAYLILNIHAAAPYSSPLSPAQQPNSEDLPDEDNLLDHIVSANLSSYLYTPDMLRDDRADLNSSWYNVAPADYPVSAYFTTSTNDKDEASSPDGWPTEAYMEFKHYLRLIASFGSIDPQMASYNLTSDSNTIFPPESLRSLAPVSFSPSGAITSGCLSTLNSSAKTPTQPSQSPP